MRVCKDASDQGGTIAQAAACPPGASFIIPSQAEASFPSKGSSHCPLCRVNRLVPAPQPHCKIYLDAYQLANYSPTDLPGVLVTAAPPATNAQRLHSQ